ncbi:hypothetical protein M011DRAFT_94453 [Sporormia fimetaria CBS 119925]|uniref:Uncharacterized protein n=1 Tax=Sporormia fimetaria CBS 119925 TaxID=1340428 RepID=A0A6A6VB69_9PLEO|nr:hypothetical protein M011DRAFT_94453 [Sporormia fimetaria CBS 119925]
MPVVEGCGRRRPGGPRALVMMLGARPRPRRAGLSSAGETLQSVDGAWPPNGRRLLRHSMPCPILCSLEACACPVKCASATTANQPQQPPPTHSRRECRPARDSVLRPPLVSPVCVTIDGLERVGFSGEIIDGILERTGAGGISRVGRGCVWLNMWLVHAPQ